MQSATLRAKYAFLGFLYVRRNCLRQAAARRTTLAYRRAAKPGSGSAEMSIAEGCEALGVRRFVEVSTSASPH